MKELTNYLNSLQVEFKKHDEDLLAKNQTEQLLLLYSYYHYFRADSSSVRDIVEGDVYDQNSFDRIAGIYIDPDSENDDIDVVLSFAFGSEKSDLDSVDVLLGEAETALFDELGRRNALARIVSNDDYMLHNNDKQVNFVVITDACPNQKIRQKISQKIGRLHSSRDNVSYRIVFGQEILFEIMEIENPSDYVEEGELLIDDPSNVLSFGSERSLIANISAMSLHDLYQKNCYKGLFAQNLRFYVKNVKVDNGIQESIQSDPDNFWYMNNGIIIICDEYRIVKKTLALKRFSIINGGQTTQLIGTTPFENDFYLQCKIIKNRYADEERKTEFISQVAGASNTQKPIQARDIIANKTEQRILKKQLADAQIFCQIKRGEKVSKIRYPKPWQSTTNEEIGQFLLAFMYQMPGTARSNKATIFTSSDRYNLIFGKEYSTDLIRDLLKIKYYYKLWNSKVQKDSSLPLNDSIKQKLVSNGMFFTVASLGAIVKLHYHLEYYDKLCEATTDDGKTAIISQYDLCHGIFSEKIGEKECFMLFDKIYKDFYRPGFKFKDDGKNDFSNFTKTNKNHHNYVVRYIIDSIATGRFSVDYKFLDDFFVVPSKEQSEKDCLLLEQYSNEIKTMNIIPKIPKAQRDFIIEKLTKFRSKTYKKNHIKAYEVFKNNQRDLIARYAPRDIDELVKLQALEEHQLEAYGEAIISIVNEVMNDNPTI